MKKSTLVLCLCTYGLPAFANEKPLIEWDISRWSPESQAACGAALSKFGLLVSTQHQTEQVYQILYHGYAMNLISEMTDPFTNELAWNASISTQDEGFYDFTYKCSDLFEGAKKAGLVPVSIDKQAAADARRDIEEAR